MFARAAVRRDHAWLFERGWARKIGAAIEDGTGWAPID
jgi:hypothetical protein